MDGNQMSKTYTLYSVFSEPFYECRIILLSASFVLILSWFLVVINRVQVFYSTGLFTPDLLPLRSSALSLIAHRVFYPLVFATEIEILINVQ